MSCSLNSTFIKNSQTVEIILKQKKCVKSICSTKIYYLTIIYSNHGFLNKINKYEFSFLLSKQMHLAIMLIEWYTGALII